MNRPSPKPDADSILDDAWGHIVGKLEWLRAVFFGEFVDNRPLSALIVDMLASFFPGVVIVTSARDAVAIILRLARHPEKRDELMEWVLLCACLIVIALPVAMAIGGAVGAGVGAAVGGIVGSELGAALRAVMLLLIKKASSLVDVVLFLQKFIKGDVLKFLRAVKFARYDKALIQALNKFINKLVGIVHSLRTHLESPRYFDSVKASIARLAEWERRFYDLQQDALRQIPNALAELDARLSKVLAETLPKETHTIRGGIEADKARNALPATQRVKDVPGSLLAKIDDESSFAGLPAKGPESKSAGATQRKSLHDTALKTSPDPQKPPDEKANTKKQSASTAVDLAHQEKAADIVERVGADIKNHPLRQAYEAEVAGLKEEAKIMVEAGANSEEVARKMWERRREIGVKYKNLTPKPLRDYIYELNSERYGDPLGPSFDFLVKYAEDNLREPFASIVESSTRPNGDVNRLLSKFKEWLIKQDSDYLDNAINGGVK
jgi:hypothetical protein